MKVALGTLKDKGDDLVAFLEPRVGTKPSLSGDEIEIEDDEVKEGVRPRHVKTYIKRFLYMNGVRKKYRVFVTGKELMIQEIELGEKEEEEKEKKKAPEKPEEAPAEEAKTEEPEAPPEEPAKEEAAKEKPKKAPSKKPRPKKKKTEDEA